MLWLMFNVFIYSSEIRYKSDSTILLWDDKARSGPLTAVDFFSTPMVTSLSKRSFQSSIWMTATGKDCAW